MEVPSSQSDRLAGWAAAVVVGLFCVMLAGFFVPAYEGVDENGYLCAARRLALTGNAAKLTTHPLEYVSENVVQTGDYVFYAKYPLGYPWLAGLAYRWGGAPAAFLVNPLLAALAVVGMFCLARVLVGGFAGAVAALVLATNSLHAGFALSALSHAGSICFAVWGMYFLWCWTQRGGRRNAVAAGGLTAYAYTIRYSEALLVLPVVAMVVWRYFSLRGAGESRRRWLAEVGGLALSAVVVLAPLWWHHWVAFGAPWRTGYDLCGESTGFAWKWFQENWWLMLTKMNTMGLLLVFPLGLAGFAYLAAHDAKRATFLGLWLVPALVLYSAYYWAPQGEGRGFVRFFVSVFPPLIVGAVALLCEAVKPRPAWTVALGAFVAVVVTVNLRATLAELGALADRLQHTRRTWDTVTQRVPAGAILISTGNALNHLEFTGNYELYSSETFDRTAIKRRLKLLEDNAPHPMHRRKVKELAHTVGEMTDKQLADLQRSLLASNVAAGRPVALVCQGDQIRGIRGRLGDAFTYERTTEWVQTANLKNGETRLTPWALYRLQPRQPQPTGPETVVTLEEQADRLQFQTRTLRAEYDAQYPGAQKAWEEIRSTEQQLRELREKVKRLAARAEVGVRQ